MREETSGVAIKTLFTNEKGVALIALICVVVLLGIIGIGLVSVMTSKQKSYPIQALSYQAINLANAGAEFAIGYARDRYQADKKDVSDSLGSQITISCGSDCGNRGFAIRYYPSLDGKAYVLKSIAQAGVAKREVRVAQFPGYVGGSGLILTQVIDSSKIPVRDCIGCDHCDDIYPEYGSDNQFLSVPITNLYDTKVYAKYMEVTGPPKGGQNNLDHLYLGPKLKYQASSDKDNPNHVEIGHKDYTCIPGPDSGCAMRPATIPAGSYEGHPNWDLEIPAGNSIVAFHHKSASLKGSYKLVFYYDFDTQYQDLKASVMTFTVTD